MSYRKAITQHNKISVRLAYSTYHNPEGKKKQCLLTTEQQYPSTIQHCSDNTHKEFGTDKCAKILLKEGKLVLS